MNTKKIPELLATAGTLDAFKTAILYGADAGFFYARTCQNRYRGREAGY